MTMKSLAALMGVFVLCFATYLVAEGAYSILLWKEMNGSLAYKVYDRAVGSSASSADRKGESNLPDHLRLASREKIEALIPEFVDAGIGVGDVPNDGIYGMNLGQATMTTQSAKGCKIVKPNLHKTMIQVRSIAYKEYAMPTLFFDHDAKLSHEIQAFLSTYAVRAAAARTNAFGERQTVPMVQSTRKVLVVGDSIAFGTNIDDEDTIASQLQRQDSTRQYVTLASPDASARDIICTVEDALARYHDQIDALVYVYSITDFNHKEKYGRPAQVLQWIKEFAEREHVADVIVVLSTDIFTVTPQFSRRTKKPLGSWLKDARAVREGAMAAGFRFINIADLAREEADARKTDFATFTMFMDGWGHLSPYGVSKVVERIRSPMVPDTTARLGNGLTD
jgi:hypothetical protein